MSSNSGGNCWSCGTELAALDYGRADTCPKCRRDTRTCRGCEFYDRGSNNDCREPSADPVLDKERSNFCDYFRPKAGLSGTGTTSRDTQKAAAEALFRKK
jgi:hypothetical protein